MSNVSKKAAATAALLGDPMNEDSTVQEPPLKKKKVKKEDTGSTSANSGPLDKQLVRLLAAQLKGMSQDEICSALSVTGSELVDPINELLSRHRIEVLTDGSNKTFLKLVSAEKVEKLRGLTPSEVVIYQHVEKSGNIGIWIKDLRRKSALGALEIPKILKELLKRKLIKCEKSIQATNKKVYMLYDIEPAREVSGGAWYDKSTGEFDVEYMRALEDAMMMFLTKKNDRKEVERARIQRGQLLASSAVETGSAGAAEVEQFLLGTGAFKTVPTEEETTKILEGLAYEGRVQRQEDIHADWGTKIESAKIRPSIAAAAAGSSSSSSTKLEEPSKKRRREQQTTYVYRVVKAGVFSSAFETIPCATCPVAKSCHEGNPISPSTCEYLPKWLAF